jgi:hypothetical protein
MRLPRFIGSAVVVTLLMIIGLRAEANTATVDTLADAGFRFDASVAPMRDGWNMLCGYAYNDRHVPAHNVRVEITGLDEANRTVTRREAYIVGDVPAAGRSYFCIPVIAAAARYQMRILTVDWGFSGGP